MRITANRRVFIVTCILWLTEFLVIGAQDWAEGFHRPNGLANLGLFCVEGMILCSLIGAALGTLEHRPLGSQISAAGVFIAMALIVSGFLAVLNLHYFPGAQAAATPLWRRVLVNAGFSVWIYLAWAAIYFALVLNRRAILHARRAAEANALALEAQNSMLRYQINPHFLFNTLNGLATLILDGQNALAEKVVISMSRFMRHSLAYAPLDRVALCDEIEAQELYLSIERVRFGDRVTFEIDVPEAALAALVPNLILQPLVENAIKHAVTTTTGPVNIRLAARTASEFLELHVTDSGGGVSPTTVGLGVGLKNIRQRLDALFGTRASLHCENLAPGFRATIRLPLQYRAI
jgi:two-component system, LytTR family, sensor kinase